MALARAHAAGGDGVDNLIASAIIALIGAVMVLTEQHQIGRAWRIGVGASAAPLYVNHGLFRISHNPVFLGMILTGLGMALVTDRWWSWLSWLAFVGSCHLQVAIEARYLASNFGASYRDFQACVPRWIGRF